MENEAKKRKQKHNSSGKESAIPLETPQAGGYRPILPQPRSHKPHDSGDLEFTWLEISSRDGEDVLRAVYLELRIRGKTPLMRISLVACHKTAEVELFLTRLRRDLEAQWVTVRSSPPLFIDRPNTFRAYILDPEGGNFSQSIQGIWETFDEADRFIAIPLLVIQNAQRNFEYEVGGRIKLQFIDGQISDYQLPPFRVWFDPETTRPYCTHGAWILVEGVSAEEQLFE